MKIKIDPLDVLFSRVVRQRPNGKCEFCGKQRKLQTSHFHGRRKRNTRWDLDNAAGLCFSCHQFLGEHPNIHTDWFRKRLGSERFEQLHVRAMTIVKVDKDKIKEYLTKLLEA